MQENVILLRVNVHVMLADMILIVQVCTSENIFLMNNLIIFCFNSKQNLIVLKMGNVPIKEYVMILQERVNVKRVLKGVHAKVMICFCWLPYKF
jgi:hypothetical protein